MHIDKPARWVVGVSLLIVVLTAVITILSNMSSKITLQLGDTILKVRPITNEAERKSGMRDMAPGLGEGILFVFDSEEMWPISTAHMKDAVDVIWLDAGKKVVEVKADVEGGESDADLLVAKKRARYALILEQGAAARFNIRPGKVATFELTK